LCAKKTGNEEERTANLIPNVHKKKEPHIWKAREVGEKEKAARECRPRPSNSDKEKKRGGPSKRCRRACLGARKRQIRKIERGQIKKKTSKSRRAGRENRGGEKKHVGRFGGGGKGLGQKSNWRLSRNRAQIFQTARAPATPPRNPAKKAEQEPPREGEKRNRKRPKKKLSECRKTSVQAERGN